MEQAIQLKNKKGYCNKEKRKKGELDKKKIQLA